MGEWHSRQKEFMCKGQGTALGPRAHGKEGGEGSAELFQAGTQSKEGGACETHRDGLGPGQEGPCAPHLRVSPVSQTLEGFDVTQLCAHSGHRAENSLDRTDLKSGRLQCGCGT